MIDPRFFVPRRKIYSLGDLCASLGLDGLTPGYADEDIYGCAPLAQSRPGDVSYLSDKRQLRALETAAATACFVQQDLAAELGAKHIIPLITPYPRATFARASGLIFTSAQSDIPATIADTAQVHPTAIVENNVEIGEGSRVGPFAVIGQGCVIGANCKLGAHVHISHTFMGDMCQVKPNTVIGGAGFGVTADGHGIVDIPHFGRVLIGDRVRLGANVCVDRGQIGDTVLGDDVKTDNLVQIAHNVTIGARSRLAALVGISGSCTIGEDCQFGGAAGIADHITIGDGAAIAAKAGVMQDVPAGERQSGVPAVPIREHMRMVAWTRKSAKATKQ